MKEDPMENRTAMTPEWGAYLSYAAAEKYAGLSRSTLWRLLRRGDIVAVRAGASVRIVRGSLDAYLAAHTWTPPKGNDHTR